MTGEPCQILRIGWDGEGGAFVYVRNDDGLELRLVVSLEEAAALQEAFPELPTVDEERRP